MWNFISQKNDLVSAPLSMATHFPLWTRCCRVPQVERGVGPGILCIQNERVVWHFCLGCQSAKRLDTWLPCCIVGSRTQGILEMSQFTEICSIFTRKVSGSPFECTWSPLLSSILREFKRVGS